MKPLQLIRTCVIFCAALTAAAAEVQGIEFSNARVRLVPQAMKNTAAYVTLRNPGGARNLVSARCDIAEAELHEHTEENGMMKMRQVAEIAVPPEGVDLKPGGYHIMLIGLKRPLQAGERIPIVLGLDDGSTRIVDFTVTEMQESADHSNMDHSAHISDSPHNDHSSHNGHAGHNHNVADMIPPAGVMGAHMHEPGKWILDYRAMLMRMDKLMDRTQTQAPELVLYGIYQNPRVIMPMTGLAPPSPFLPAARIEQNQFRYMSVGRNMSMEMHMLSAMYQYSENTMLMFMAPYMKSRMQMIANNFQTANMSARGVGDVSLSALFRALSKGDHSLFLGTGISFATGSIDEKDWMPQMGKSPVAYGMQPGAGTQSILVQSAYTGRAGIISWGSQLDGTIRVGKNDNNYRAGNRYSATAWASVRTFDWMSFSLRAQRSKWENYKGQDPGLDPAMDPGNDPNLQGGSRVDVLGGMNFVITGGPLTGVRFFAEAGVPVRQHLNGPQMATTWVGSFGTQIGF